MLESVFPEIILQQAGSTLERIMTESLRHAPPAEAPLLAWPMVCGAAVAQRTRAVSFVDGTLSIAVADKGWKSELQTHVPQYVMAIRKYTGQSIKKIEFVVAPIAGEPR